MSGRGGRRGRRGGRGRKRGEGGDAPKPVSARPTPVRELTAPEGDPPEPVDATEAELEDAGTTWTVRVLGRSGGSAAGTTPLLALGFWERAPDRGDAPDREAIVVGRKLADLTVRQLSEALARSAPPETASGRKPFFEEGKRRSGRGQRGR